MQPLVRFHNGGVALRGNHARMAFADALELNSVLLVAEIRDWITATECKTMPLGQLVPEFLETQGGFALPVRPQQGHHFPEGVNPAIALSQLRNHAANNFVEPSRIG